MNDFFKKINEHLVFLRFSNCMDELSEKVKEIVGDVEIPIPKQFKPFIDNYCENENIKEQEALLRLAYCFLMLQDIKIKYIEDEG